VTSDDPLYQTSADGASNTAGDQAGLRDSEGGMAGLAVELTNVDDDVVGIIATAGHRPGVCSEPYYGEVETLEIYLATKPKATVLLTLASTDPVEAGPTISLVSISPEDWYARAERAPPETRARCVSRQHTLESLARPPASLFSSQVRAQGGLGREQRRPRAGRRQEV
jgi:hypothetical protein